MNLPVNLINLIKSKKGKKKNAGLEKKKNPSQSSGRGEIPKESQMRPG